MAEDTVWQLALQVTLYGKHTRCKAVLCSTVQHLHVKVVVKTAG